MLHLKQEQDQQTILKRWILKILPDRNCSIREEAETESSFTKSLERTGGRKKSNQAGKRSSIWAFVCQTGRAGPILLVSIIQVASGFPSSLWNQSQGAFCRILHTCRAQGCSGAHEEQQQDTGVSALPLQEMSLLGYTKNKAWLKGLPSKSLTSKSPLLSPVPAHT